jgi:hypothetical protein
MIHPGPLLNPILPAFYRFRKLSKSIRSWFFSILYSETRVIPWTDLFLTILGIKVYKSHL